VNGKKRSQNYTFYREIFSLSFYFHPRSVPNINVHFFYFWILIIIFSYAVLLLPTCVYTQIPFFLVSVHIETERGGRESFHKFSRSLPFEHPVFDMNLLFKKCSVTKEACKVIWSHVLLSSFHFQMK
jgi:hypothetical protein